MGELVTGGGPTLDAIAEEIRALTLRAATDLIAVGHRLLAAYRVLGPSRFGPWVGGHFAWGPPAAAAMMRAALAFGAVPPPVVERFEATALYRLSAPTAPPAVRRLAIAAAGEGTRVTAAVARQMLAAARTRVSRRGAPRTAPRPRPEAGEPEAGPDVPLGCAAVERLVGEGAVVRVYRLDDAESDDPASRPWAVAITPKGGPPVTHVSRDSVWAALALAAGLQPERTCQQCGRTGPLLETFSRKTGNPLGRSHHCRKCETERVGVSKKLKRGTADKSNPSPPPPATHRGTTSPPFDPPAAPPAGGRTPPTT